ncbi:S-layer homology domain-containing protein [Candidatus Gracilibacteria bacterium]|nr:S-layer homology domain-containing protein [Candidatus Gracilibacteria bacterium]
MAKAKPVKTVKKTKKHVSAPAPVSSFERNLGMAKKSMKVSVLLFAFVLLLTVGALVYQQTSKTSSLVGKNAQTSVLGEATTDFLDIDQQQRNDKDFMFALQYLTGKGIMLGYSDNTIRPNNPITRAEFLKMLTIALKADTTGFGKACFKDVVATEWYAPYVCFAKDAGWVNGYGDGKILPNNQISLAEVLKIIVTAEKWNVDDAKDYPVPKDWKIVKEAWYVPYIKVAYKKFLLYNYRFAKNLDPAVLLSRKDVILILFSGILVDTIKVDQYDPKYIQQLFKQEEVPLPPGATTNEAPPVTTSTTPEATPKPAPKK